MYTSAKQKTGFEKSLTQDIHITHNNSIMAKILEKIVYTVMLSDQPQLRCLLFHMKNSDTEENIELQNKLYSQLCTAVAAAC